MRRRVSEMVKLNAEEKVFLKNLRTQEQMCVDKYKFYAAQAKDPQLQQLFGDIGRREEKHYNLLSALMKGELPEAKNRRSDMVKAYEPKAAYTANSKSADKLHDQFLCTDAIATEKYVAGAYNDDLFRFSMPTVRDLLNTLQTDEQNHAEMLWKYKMANGMT